MCDRIHRKDTSRRDCDDYHASKPKKRHEKVRDCDRRLSSSAYDERRRDRHKHSDHFDDTRSMTCSKNSIAAHVEHHSKNTTTLGKSHLVNERDTVNAAKETSTKVADDSEFNWEKHRSTLDAIFFQDEDMIKKGSVEYDEFWIFLQKYQAFSRKQPARSKSLPHSAKYAFQPNRFHLPEKYDKRYRINVSLLNKDVKGLLHRRRDALSLTEEKVATFRSILLHYVDFLQKQKFARLIKVKRDQQNLPIYEHRQEIVDAVAGHQVVVVAGDTGCGKSTQVPQYLLAAGYTHIACTQPRRIACISLSRRVAYETLNEYGSEVAYQVFA